MIACPRCGQQNPDGFRLCGMCGTALAAEPSREQRKTVTVVFCDVTGSTALGERLDPESLRHVMARYFEEMSAAIERHGGTVEKFIGDAVMAVFGIPVTHEDDALRAVRAAAEMRERLEALNAELERDYGTRLASRVGVNTGEVVTGTQERLATGDAVNVAARLEQAAAPGEILLGDATLDLVRGAATVESAGPLVLKGKAEGVPAHRLIAVAAAAPRRVLDSPLVGREHERRLLADAWERVVSGDTCHLFTLLGPAGVGKSRLVAEFLGGIEGTVLRGRCLSYGEGITYWPVVEVVKQLLGTEPDDRLGALVGDPEAEAAIRSMLAESDRPTSSEQIAWATRRLLEAAARETPLVILLDDIHWGEPTFLDLVDTMAVLSRGAPILLLCVARPELLDQRPDWAGSKLGATTVLLEPLSAAEAEQLIDNLLAETPLPEGVRARVRATAEGNPLFIEETVAMLREHGEAAGGIPPTIQALLAARLDLLEPSERHVLERGSIEGQAFHRGAVQALGPEDTDVTGRLVRLVRKELVRPDRAVLPGEDAYRFRHLLIRDAAYDALPKATRAELHQRFAVWLDDHGTTLVERDEVVGYHLEQAFRYRSELGPVDDPSLAASAAARLEAAGRRAVVLGDTAAAVKLLERSLSLFGDAADPRLELALSGALLDAGRPADAMDRAIRAVRLAAAAGDRVAELEAEVQRRLLVSLMDPPSAIDLPEFVESVRPELEAAGDDRALAALWTAMGWIHHGACRMDQQLECYQRASEHARRTGDAQLGGRSMHYAAAGMCVGTTPLSEVIPWLEEHREPGDPWWDIWLSEMLANIGRFDESAALQEEAVEWMSQRGMGLGLALISQNDWNVARLREDVEAAERAARRGYDDLIGQGQRGWASTAAAQLALSLCDLGRFDEAERLALEAAEIGGSDDVMTLVMAECARARVASARGDHEHAIELARGAVARAEQMEAPQLASEVLLDFAHVTAAAGRPADAADAARRALELLEAKGAIVAAARARRLLEGYRLTA